MKLENKSWTKSFTNKSLELVLLVTEQCNFRCLYCYEDFKLGKISLDVIEAVKNLIKNRIEDIQELRISFFGGEPLMNKQAVEDISSWASQLSKQHNVKYFGGIATNGYSLDEKVFMRLIQSNVKTFQITLDGDKQEHDKLRPTINGKGTFDNIYNNLIAMSKSVEDFKCTIRFNIADSNFYSVRDFIENYAVIFQNDLRFRFHFHPIFGMPELTLTKDEQLDELKRTAVNKGLFFNEFSNEPAACYASKANSFVIRADGRVQKCTVALESEINNIGHILKDGTLDLNEEKLRKWIFAENKECPVQSLTLEKLIIPYEKAGKYKLEEIDQK